MMSLPPLASLNSVSCDEFVEALRPLFEAAGPLGQALCTQRPFDSYAALLDAAEATALRLSRDEQIAVVNAHPRIGAAAANLSELSRREQGTQAGHVDELLREVNEQYESRFGHRFVVFVNGRPKSEILEVLRGRLAGTPDQELRTAMHDMLAIARDRLRRLS